MIRSLLRNKKCKPLVIKQLFTSSFLSHCPDRRAVGGLTSQPPLPLAVPLSRLPPRGGGGGFFTRPIRAMKHSKCMIVLVFMLLCVGCAEQAGLKEVGFEWFNLSTNQIWVTELVGLPAEASAGRLMPSHAEDQLESSESIFPETVRVGKQIKIVWKDNGTQGWPGGLKVPGSVPPGATMRRSSTVLT